VRRPRGQGGSQPSSQRAQGPQTLILEYFPSTATARALSPNGRAHWSRRSAAKNEVAERIGEEAAVIRLRRVIGTVRLLFRFVYPVARTRDVDNLTTGVTKAAIDALVRGKWIEADDSEHVLSVEAIEVVERGQRRLEIVLTPSELEV
jgi:Holliday junction resolvase RusA-like endonuclease